MINNKLMLEHIDYLIRIKSTGRPCNFAKKIGVSERQLYRILDCLKELGCPIVYDRYAHAYKYEVEGNFKMCFQKKHNSPNSDTIMDKKNLNNTKGGFCENNLHTDGWWHYCNLNLLRGI